VIELPILAAAVSLDPSSPLFPEPELHGGCGSRPIGSKCSACFRGSRRQAGYVIVGAGADPS
jgi:hypothetical protein